MVFRTKPRPLERKGCPIDTIEAFRRAVDAFDARMKEVGSDDWKLGTPCTEWSVHDLVNHLVNEALWVVPLLEGKTVEEVGSAFDGDLLGSEPLAAWVDARDGELEAISEDGVLDRTVNVSWGQISGREYLEQVLADHLLHGWDLARAIGASEEFDPELVEHVYEGLKPQEEMLRSTGAFGDKVEVPEDADTQTKLLALVGREA